MDTISPPLLDRLETIKLSGYLPHEKFHILNNHLLPKTLANIPLQNFSLQPILANYLINS